jgi:hypothetical protein
LFCAAQDDEGEGDEVNLEESKEVAKLRVAARRAGSTSSKLQAQLVDMEASLGELKAKVSEQNTSRPYIKTNIHYNVRKTNATLCHKQHIPKAQNDLSREFTL